MQRVVRNVSKPIAVTCNDIAAMLRDPGVRFTPGPAGLP